MKVKNQAIHNIRKMRLLGEMSRHIGRERAIGMGELYEIVFDEDWENRINHTRRLRELITEARYEGVPICSDSARSGGGYWLAAAGSEMQDFLASFHRRAVRSLVLEARLRKISLPELLGQMQMNLEEGRDEAA